MPIAIERDKVQEFLNIGGQLIEVLPEKEFRRIHLAGAINIPLQSLDRETAARLDHTRPLMVYCYDFNWDLAPRAAARLESLGFANVFYYKPGKMDWLAFGMPADGDEASAMLIEHIERGVPTCRLTDSAEAARQAAAKMSFSSCAIVNEENVVLGLIRSNESEVNPLAVAADVMELGPKTLRPSSTVKEAKQVAQKTGRTEMLVTSSDGKLIGVFKAAGQERK